MQDAPKRQTKGQLSLATAHRRLGKRAITAEHLSVWAEPHAGPAGTSDPGGQPLLRDFSYDFSPEDRVGIIGANGSGKSTLLDLIAGRRQPQRGRLELGSTVRLAYFDQQAEGLASGRGLERKVIDFVQEEASRIDLGGEAVTASQLLERFLFPPAQQHSPIGRLSGGERRRLYLCRLLISAPNVLLLDEPTNDLDVHTLTVLEDFLEDFRGCVVVVSHDRYFLDRTVDRLFCFEAGELKRYEGNYSAYLERVASGTAAPLAVAKTPAPAQAPLPAIAPPPAPRRRSFKQSRELEDLERSLPEWEERRAALEAELATGAGGDYARLETLTGELAALVERIEHGEERWLELSELSA
jgi:ATP-binding cassette subfamily F protein uup